MKVDFFRHNINKQDIERTNLVLNSIFLTTGEVVHEFEENFASYVKAHLPLG